MVQKNQSLDISADVWKKNIKKWAADLGFVAAGFTSAAPVEGLKEMLERRAARGEATSFESVEWELRVNPKAVWPECETVVVLAYPLPLSTPARAGEGVLARSAVGEDYHRLVQEKLEALSAKILEDGWPSLPPKTQVDTGPLVERAFALRAGVGWIGRNQQLIVPGYGSFVALALLLLDRELAPDCPVSDQCGACTLCRTACPAQVIGRETFAARRCFSYLTQSKEVLDRESAQRLGGRIFGCDTCQEVCPHNRERIEQERERAQELEQERKQELERDRVQEQMHEKEHKRQGEPVPFMLNNNYRGVDLYDTLNLTKGEFNRRFRASAAGWRGKGILQRNAYLALKQAGDPRLQAWLKERAENGEIPALILPYIDSHSDS